MRNIQLTFGVNSQESNKIILEDIIKKHQSRLALSYSAGHGFWKDGSNELCITILSLAWKEQDDYDERLGLCMALASEISYELNEPVTVQTIKVEGVVVIE